jgi:hypothetical protein
MSTTTPQERAIAERAATYVCAMCKGEFTKGWSEEEAIEELDALWGVSKEECDVVCDDCFKLIMGEA